MKYLVGLGIMVALAAATSARAASVVAPARTLWLVQPLYPGQPFMVERTLAALMRLFPEEERSYELFGQEQLVRYLEQKKVDATCFLQNEPCTGGVLWVLQHVQIGQVILLKGGQEGGGYRFRIVHLSLRESSSEAGDAAAGGTAQLVWQPPVQGDEVAGDLDKALRDALSKVVPMSSVLEVMSDPAGATVFVDGEKVGATPLVARVLPGQRRVRLEAPGYAAWEEVRTIAARTTAPMNATLRTATADDAPGRVRWFGRTDKARHYVEFTYDLTGLAAPPWQAQGERRLGTARFDGSGVRTAAVRSGGGYGAWRGVSGAWGIQGRYWGWTLLGASYAQTVGSNALQLELEQAPAATPQQITAWAHWLVLRALQPQLQVRLKRLTLAVGGGAALRVAHVLAQDTTSKAYAGGFWGPALLAEAAVTLRFFLGDDLFVTGTYRYGMPLAGVTPADTVAGGQETLAVGVGYAF